jgi:hypothetical protein
MHEGRVESGSKSIPFATCDQTLSLNLVRLTSKGRFARLATQKRPEAARGTRCCRGEISELVQEWQDGDHAPLDLYCPMLGGLLRMLHFEL